MYQHARVGEEGEAVKNGYFRVLAALRAIEQG